MTLLVLPQTLSLALDKRITVNLSSSNTLSLTYSLTPSPTLSGKLSQLPSLYDPLYDLNSLEGDYRTLDQ